MSDLLDRVRSTLGRHDLLPASCRVVVAVSGGPDSMVLLHLLRKLNEAEHRGWSLHVAHLNHGIRGHAAELDAELVRSRCAAMGLPFHESVVEVPALSGRGRGSVEAVARRERYLFLRRVADEIGATRVAVGHHADDNAETILHRIVRGTGLAGLAGIPVIRPIARGSDIRLVRPLLECRRQELLGFAAAHAVPYRQDATNAGTAAMRGRIRNELLPLLAERYNPAVVSALLRLGRQARRAEEHLGHAVDGVWDSVASPTDRRGVRLNAARLAEQPAIIQAEILRRTIAHLSVPTLEYGHDWIEILRGLAVNADAPPAIDLPSGLRASRDGNSLIIGPNLAGPGARPPDPIPVAVPGTTCHPALGICLRVRVEPLDRRAFREFLAHKEPGAEWLNADAIRPPCVLRTRRHGDRMRPLGAAGSKTLGDLFTDLGIPPAERDRLPILCDSSGPLWVVGHRIAHRARVTDTTGSVLKLAVRPLRH